MTVAHFAWRVFAWVAGWRVKLERRGAILERGLFEKVMFQQAQSFGDLRHTALKPNRLRPLSILRLWGLPNLERPQSFRGPRLKKIEASQHFGTVGASKHWEASILFRFGFKKIEASQYFGTLGAPKPGEASIFLGFTCKNAGRPQKTLMTQSFGSLGRPAWNTKKIEASQHFETLRASAPREAPIFPRSKTQKDWGLSTLWDSGSFKTLRGLNFVQVRIQKNWGLSILWDAGSSKTWRGLNIFGVYMQKRWEAPKDSNDSIFWKSWKTSLKHKKNWGLSAFWNSESFHTSRGPNLSEIQDSKRLRPLNTLGLWELQNIERPQFCSGPDSKKLRPLNTLGRWELQNLERPQYFWGLNAKTLGGPKRL